MTSIRELWLRGESPIVNGIFFANGRARRVAGHPEQDVRGPKRISTNEISLLSSAELQRSTTLIEVAKAVDVRRGLVASVGEGGMGSDGFIALSDGSDNLCWLAFFDFSNPFVGVELCGDFVHAENNLSQTWIIAVDDPDSIQIVASSAQ